MFHVLYNVLICPLIFLLESVLNAAYGLSGNYGLSILFVSIVVNILISPFYSLADSWQKEEQNLLRKMQKKKEDIKAVFKGDEQYFYIRTLYRQNGYSPPDGYPLQFWPADSNSFLYRSISVPVALQAPDGTVFSFFK